MLNGTRIRLDRFVCVYMCGDGGEGSGRGGGVGWVRRGGGVGGVGV